MTAPAEPLPQDYVVSVIEAAGQGLPLWQQLGDERHGSDGQEHCVGVNGMTKAALRATCKTFQHMTYPLMTRLGRLKVGKISGKYKQKEPEEGRQPKQDQNQGDGQQQEQQGLGEGGVDGGAGQQAGASMPAQEQPGSAGSGGESQQQEDAMQQEQGPGGQQVSTEAGPSTGQPNADAQVRDEGVPFTEDKDTWPSTQRTQYRQLSTFTGRLTQLQSARIIVHDGGASELMELVKSGCCSRHLHTLEMCFHMW